MLNRTVSSLFLSILLAMAVLPGCVTLEDRQRAAAEDRVSYRVKSGDSLYSIAWRFGLDARAVAQWNRLQHPYTIFPGQLIFLSPLGTAQTQTAQRSPAMPQTSRARPIKPYIPNHRVDKPSPVKPPVAKLPKQQNTTTTSPIKISKPPQATPREIKQVRWQWPLKIKHHSNAVYQPATSRGVQVKGRLGQSVFAAADGKVVYSGNGLKGYGELIIIKHSDELISAYAHNRKRFVPQEMWVKRGQKIAELGVKAGEKDAVLYFEIRKFGKPVDPMAYLPAL